MYLAALFAAAALANPFCADVAKLADGAREPLPFQALKDEGFKPKLLANGCFPGGEGFFCQQSNLPADLTAQSVATRISACLPGAKISQEKQPGSKPETVVTGSGLRVSIEETGKDGVGQGRILRIQVMSDS